MKAFYPAFYFAGLLLLLSSVVLAAPRLEKAYFQALGGHLLSEAFTRAGMIGQEAFACAQARTLDKKALQLATQALEALGRARTEQAFLLQGRAHCLRGDVKQAIAAYQQYTLARPKNPLGYLELGFAYERSLNQKMAVECWVRANVTADQFWMEGNKAYEAGRADDALQWLDRAIALRPVWNRPYYTKSLVYSSLGMTEQAIYTLRTALSYNPDDPEIYFRLCEVFANAQNYPAALVACHKAAENRQFVIPAWLKIAEIEAKQGNVTATLNAYRKALENSEFVSSSETDWVWKRVWPFYAFGSYMIDTGEFDQAEVYFKKALDLDPGKQYAVFSFWGLGRVAYQKAQYEEAQGYLQQALQLQPDYYIRSQVYLVFAQIELAQGNTLEGIEYLRKALNEHPENQGLHLMLAETLQEAGLLEEAVKEYELYLSKWPDDSRVQSVFQELKSTLQSQTP